MIGQNQKSQKYIWYHAIELILGFMFYTPNYQARFSQDTLSYKQTGVLLFSGLIMIHAATNIFILLYNLLNISTEKKASTPPKKKDHDKTELLLSPSFPKIDKPLIDEKLLSTPTKSDNPQMKRKSLLSDSTLDLIKWGTSPTSNLSTSFLLNDSQISNLVQSPNSSFFKSPTSSQEDLNESKPVQTQGDLSFYMNKSFLNSFDENEKNKSYFGNDSWTGNTGFNQQLSKDDLKKQISEQIYRVSTPPTSPSRSSRALTKLDNAKTQPDPSDVRKISKFILPNKHERIEKIKLWLNRSLLIPLNTEIEHINKTLKQKGIRSLEKMTFEYLNSIIHDESVLLEKDEKSIIQIQHHRSNLESYRAQLFRILPYFESVAEKNETMESVIGRVQMLSTHAYLSCFDKALDNQLVSNCVVEFFNGQANSDGSITPKNWFGNRFLVDSKQSETDKAFWLKGDSRSAVEDKKLRGMLMPLFSQKKINGRKEYISTKFDTAGETLLLKTNDLIDKINPFLVSLSDKSFILVKNDTLFHEFTGNLAIFEAYLSLFDCLAATAEFNAEIPF